MKLFRLLPLECPKCGSRIKSRTSDVVHFCDNCGTGSEFTGDSLEIVETKFARPIIDSKFRPELFLPFWSFNLDISIKGKEVYLPFIFRKGIFSPKDNLFKDGTLIEKILKAGKEQEKEKELDYTIYVPSFPTTGTFAYSSNIGNSLTKAQPKITFYEDSKQMFSCIYNSRDALAIAEDEYISLQSNVIPNLLALDLSFNVKSKTILGIPYIKKEKGIYYDQIIGEIILANALKKR